MNTTRLRARASKTERDMANAAMNKIHKIEKTLEKKIGEYTDDVKEIFSDAPDNVARYVKKHPFRSVGVSVVAGMVAARMLSKLFRE